MGPRPAAEPAGGRSDPRRAPGAPRGGRVPRDYAPYRVAYDLDGYASLRPKDRDAEHCTCTETCTAASDWTDGSHTLPHIAFCINTA